MVRKITPATGGWSKCVGTADTQRDFEAAAYRTLSSAPWKRQNWQAEVCERIALRLAQHHRLPLPLTTALRRTIAEIVRLEAQSLRIETVVPDKPDDAFAHRARLRALLQLQQNPHFIEQWIGTLTVSLQRIIDAVPPDITQGNSHFTVPFVDLVPDSPSLVSDLISGLMRFSNDDPHTVRPGSVIAARIKAALLRHSRITEDAASKNPHRLVSPAESNLSGTALVETFLGATPLAKLLRVPVPFKLTGRFAHHHIVATPGAGKTNLLGALLCRDFDEVARGAASVIVLDSQGDFINSIVRGKDFAPGGRLHDRLAYIDATDILYPPQLNFFARRGDRSLTPLDKRTEYSNLVDLLLFLFGALKQEATGRQETLIKAVASLIQEIPDATLMTLNTIFEPGDRKRPTLEKFSDNLARLDPTMQEFFAVDFSSPEFSQSRAQMRARVQSLVTDPVFRAMFSAKTQKLDFGSEMNAGKVILINAHEDLLKTGTEVFGRFFIALAGQATQARQNIAESKRMPTYFYIDECYKFIKEDSNMEKILDTGRKYRLGVILAHQRLNQLSEALRSAASGAHIKMFRAPVCEDAGTLAKQLNTSPDYFDGLPKHAFATRITGMHQPLTLTIPLSPLATARHMTDAEFAEVRNVMRRKYAQAPSSDKSVEAAPTNPPTSPPADDPAQEVKSDRPDDFAIKPGKDW